MVIDRQSPDKSSFSPIDTAHRPPHARDTSTWGDHRCRCYHGQVSLTEYRRKRDFSKTPEPGPRPARPAGQLYLVQKHDASRLHYDLRLELDGVLKSWAVPKGPSLDPRERRLAVQVEDHPVEYGDFEGIIPEGEYGGGTVMLWDRGTWEPESAHPERDLEQGKLKFRLHGEKLQGVWNLVRMPDGKNWLLIKSRDEEAGDRDVLEDDRSVASGRSLDEIARAQEAVWHGQTPDPSELAEARRRKLPSRIKPMLARLAAEVPSGEGWLHEIKHDGYRILAVLNQGQVRLLTRSGQDWTDPYPDLVGELQVIPVNQAVLDGELVALKPDGTSDFQALQAGSGERVYFVFDLPYCEGYDLCQVPLLERKRLLQTLLPGEGPVRYSDHLQGQGEEFFQQACQAGVEGIVCKRAASGYVDRRSGDWLKVKCKKVEEFVVGGWTDPSGSRQGLGSLLVGTYQNGKLVYHGKVGTGFTRKSLEELSSQLDRLARKTSPFDSPPGGKGLHWVTPRLVARVEYSERTRDGLLRHPSFKGLREDKPAREVTGEVRVTGDAVRISHPDRVVYPELGVTKLEVAQYYRAVAERMLPHVVRRPLSIVRCPRGRAEKCFFHRHHDKGFPDAVKGVTVQEKDGPAEHLMIEDQEGLLSLVQFGALEIHPWGCRVEALDRPDRMIFDLDPDPELDWEKVIEAALEVRQRLETLGLTGFCKTTGGKGLHVVVPLDPGPTWEHLHDFSQAFVQQMARDAPRRYVDVMTRSKRQGKIYVDFLRNNEGATAVAAYSTRSREGATVSAPLAWDEVTPRLSPVDLTVRTVPERADPWSDFGQVKQGLPR